MKTIKDLLKSGKSPLEFEKGLSGFTSISTELKEYTMGIRKSFSAPVDILFGTLFERKVWKVLQEIPYGQCVSYQWVALKLGSPRAARAVGNAVGKNPVPILIPCHRVIHKDGNLGGFSSGLHIKRALLEIEGCYKSIKERK